MSKHPAKRPGLAPSDVRKILKAFGIEVDNKVRTVALLGIRGYYQDSMGAQGKNDRGLYDDAAWICSDSRCHPFNFNTDPSAWRTGIATLKANHKYTFIPGKHKIESPTGYAAFRQHGAFTVTRDNQGDDTGYFGINLHRGGEESTSSLGCQTVPPRQWREFRDLLFALTGTNEREVLSNPSGVKGKEFVYILVDVKRAEEIIGRQI
jgi:lysozyme